MIYYTAMAKYDSLRKLKRNKTLLDYRKEHPDASLAEIGEVFGITKERVRQLLKTLNQTE